MAPDEEWDDDEWDEDYDETILGFSPLTFKLASVGSVLVILMLVLSLVLTSFGFYSGVSHLKVMIDVEEHYSSDDIILNAEVMANSPLFGSLESEGDYKIMYDGEVRTTGKLVLGDDGRDSISLPYEDFFVDNGDYTLTVMFGEEQVSDSVELNMVAKTVTCTIFFIGHDICDDDLCDPVLTTITFGSSEDPLNSKTVAPTGSGKIEIYFYNNNAPTESEKYDAAYWNNDNSRPSDDWELVQTITFATELNSGYWQYDGGSVEEFAISNFQMSLDPDYFRQNQDGDYTMSVSYNNTFVSEVEGADLEQKDGRSDWRWFFLDGKG